MKTKMVPFIVSLAMFMEAVDATVINTAIPVMAVHLNVNPIDLKIALISYLLSLAIFIPISGWLADKFGIKRIFIIGLCLFTISSLFCGIAQTVLELVISRLFQGLGGSIMLPIGRLIIIRSYEKHKLLIVMNQVVMVGALGMMLGPTLGGLITHYLSWHWIFLINIPVGVLNIILAHYCLVEMRPERVHALDKVGFVLFGMGLAALTFGLSALSESTIQKSNISIIILGAIILLIIYFLHSYKVSHPVVNTQLFHFRTFRISAFGNLFARLSFGGVPFLIPLLLQINLEYSPQLSGFLLAPTALGVVIAKPISLQLLRLLGYRQFLIWNTLTMGLLLSILTLVNEQTSFFAIAFFTFMFGFLSALQYTGMNSIAYSQISELYFSSATSIISTLQQIAQSFGVAVSAILIRFFSRNDADQTVVTMASLHHTFLAMSVFTSFSILIFMKLKAEDGLELLHKNSYELKS
jgi:EmrB/QacA subfamily drug resistance transporter